MKKNYEKLIQERLDKDFTIILRVAGIVAFFAAFMLFISPVSKIYAFVNLVAGVFFLIFSIFSNQIHTVYKILLLIIVTGVISVISFIGGGFTSAFLILLVLANIMAVLFLKSIQSRTISVLSIGLMVGMAFYSTKVESYVEINDYYLTWGLQIISFILFLVVFHKSAYSIKNYLFENISKLEKSIENSDRLAYFDDLTGLPNLNKFKIEVEKRIEKNKKDGFLIILNLKSLSLINSTLGYATGDLALQDVRDVFLRLKEEHETISRTGGNEFSIWFEGITEQELYQKFSLIMGELKKQSFLMKKKLEFFSVYAKFTYESDTFEDCYRKATLTLTHAKSKRIYEFLPYNNQIELILRRKEMLKDLIEEGLKEGEFELYYQAKIDSRTEKVYGVEGLARWNSKEVGMVSPYEFIPVIESINMSHEFGDFVIQRACSDFISLQKKYGKDIRFSINISPSHIKDEAIIKTIKDALEKYQIPPNRLIVEITENLLIEGFKDVKEILKKLKELNVLISLDDFGTGYSSLNYLGQLEFDELKIDKIFIDQIESSPLSYILIDNIIQLSKKFNLEVIAEGVETKEQCEVLDKLGCYLIQGFYFSKPEKL